MGKSPAVQDPSTPLRTCAAPGSPPSLFPVQAAKGQAGRRGDGCGQADAPSISYGHGMADVTGEEWLEEKAVGPAWRPLWGDGYCPRSAASPPQAGREQQTQPLISALFLSACI